MDKELREKIDQRINYLAHEIVVPITGKPSTPYEVNAVRKYKAELSLFADQILAIIKEALPELVMENFDFIVKKKKHFFLLIILN